MEANPKQGMLAEWTLELIAREAIRYADEEARNGDSLRSWSTLARIANALRDLENQIYGQLAGQNLTQLELLRMAHRQFVWQQQRFGWRWIIRYYMLFNTPTITTLTEQEVGLTIDQVYLIGMAYIGIFTESLRATRKLTYGELTSRPTQPIDKDCDEPICVAISICWAA